MFRRNAFALLVLAICALSQHGPAVAQELYVQGPPIRVGERVDLSDEGKKGHIILFFSLEVIEGFIEAGNLLPPVGHNVTDDLGLKWMDVLEAQDFSKVEVTNDYTVLPVLGDRANNLPVFVGRKIMVVSDPEGPNRDCANIAASNGRCRNYAVPGIYFPAIVNSPSRGNGVLAYVGPTMRQIYDPTTGILYGEKMP